MCGVLNSKQLTWIFTPSNHNSYIRVILKSVLFLCIYYKERQILQMYYIFMCVLQKSVLYTLQSKTSYIDVLHIYAHLHKSFLYMYDKASHVILMYYIYVCVFCRKASVTSTSWRKHCSQRSWHRRWVASLQNSATCSSTNSSRNWSPSTGTSLIDWQLPRRERNHHKELSSPCCQKTH